MADFELTLLDDVEMLKVRTKTPWDILEERGIMVYFADGNWQIWNHGLINLQPDTNIAEIAERCQKYTGATEIAYGKLRGW